MRQARVFALALVFAGLLRPATASPPIPDPTAPNQAVKVASAKYEDGAEALRVSKAIANPYRIPVKGVVYYADPPAADSPLVAFIHGMHYVCKNKQWAYPCQKAEDTIDSYLGYEYVGKVLASRGFIVISIDANTINSISNGIFDDAGADLRGELVIVHLARWRNWSANGSNVPGIGNTFKGKVDLNNVGLVGHSRGGEGVVHAFALNYNVKPPKKFGIKGVFVLAGTNIVKNLTGVKYPVPNQALGVLLPYCDGDVEDLVSVTFYDDSRYRSGGDTAEKSYVAVMGANHNYYNTVWATDPTGVPDDWKGVAFKRRDPRAVPDNDPVCGKPRGDSNPYGRLSPDEQQQTGIGFMAGFMRLYLKNETALRPLYTGDLPLPDSLKNFRVINGFQAAVGDRLNVNQYASMADLGKNTLGGDVTTNMLKSGKFCTGNTGCGTVEAHRPPTGQFSARWDQFGASFENGIPDAKKDMSGYKFLSFRVGVNALDKLNGAATQDFLVTLADTNAKSESEVLSAVHTLFFPPAMLYATKSGYAGQRTILHTVRIPLGSFVKVDLKKIKAVSIDFQKNGTGGLLFNDLVFAQ